MTKRLTAKHKIDRRMGENIWGRPKSPVNKREYGPGQHGQRRKSKPSDFGIQLKAKQKLKGYYANISERQFRAVYEEASRMKGDSSENLIGLLERRLDVIVYRAKFVPTIFAATSSSVMATSRSTAAARRLPRCASRLAISSNFPRRPRISPSCSKQPSSPSVMFPIMSR